MAADNNMKRLAHAFSKIEGSSVEYEGGPTQKECARTLIRRSVSIQLAAVHANGANIIAANANPTQFRAPFDGRVLTAHFIPTAALTEHASNNVTIRGVKTQANGVGVGTDVATANTNTVANGGTGSHVAGASLALTVTDDANARFTQGQVLSATVTQNSSGVALPAGVVQYLVELEGPADEYGI